MRGFLTFALTTRTPYGVLAWIQKLFQKSKYKIKENATTLAALEQTPPIAPGSLGRTRTPQQRDVYGLGLGGLGFIGPLLRLQGLDAACAMRTPTAKAMAISRIHQSLESIRAL